jgi:energy-converting hydrogenase Eha subunit H
VPVDVIDETVVSLPSDAPALDGADPILETFARRIRERMASAASEEDRIVLRLALHAGLAAAGDREGRHAA